MKIISSTQDNMYDFNKLNDEALELLYEGETTTVSLIRGKDGKMYVDMSDLDGSNELYPVDNITDSWIHFN